MKQINTPNNLPDAAESNAGDDFHVIWSVRKALELLNFRDDGLKAISIEGLASEDAVSDNSLLAVDLTEYYGGDTFDAATKVIVSQLKYSTRHADKSWTAAAICTGKKHAWKGSIVHRLADFYKGFREGRSANEVMQKLKIKLVSNRPAADNLQTAVSTIQKKLFLVGSKTNVKTALGQLDTQSASIIQRLADSSGLDDAAFLEFIQLLDFSDCGAGSRFFQEQQAVKAIAEISSYKTEDEFNRLYRLVHRKMMPEARGDNLIKQTDILYEFKLAELEDLFPVKARFEPKEQLIERDQLDDIEKAIESASEAKLILHGGAGMGKSSLVHTLPEKLPTGSVTLLFDCYGAGTYLDSDDERHKPENAFLQLSNQLALIAGTPLLVARGLPADVYLRQFKKRLAMAAQIIQKGNPSALVVVVIDAADNSVHAASQSSETSFVNELAHMSVPAGCRLLFTSRTERVSTLPIPDELDKIQINGFSFCETDKYLKRAYPSLSPEEVEEFRTLTYATPRVMAYALSMPGNTLAEKVKPLKPGGKTLNDIFRLRIKEAQNRSGNKDAIKNFLHYLILLPRPVPAIYIQSLCGLSDTLLQDIQTDLWHGLIFENNQFSFRDEDFENFLRATYTSDPLKLTKIADAFLAAADGDAYASLHMGNALRQANKGKELIEIVLEGKFQKHPQDPIRLKEVIVERTRLAMELSASSQNKLDLLKLQLAAAEAAKTNTILEDILLNNPELASSFGNAAMAQKLYFQSGNPGWFGSVHFRSAAVHARHSETHLLAKEHLKKAIEWLRYREGVREDKREDFRLTAKDVAYGAETVLHLSGVKACAEWLSRWHPNSFAYTAVKELLNNLVEKGEHKRLTKWIKPFRLLIEIKLLIAQTFFEEGLKPPFSLEEMAGHIKKIRRLSKSPNFSMASEVMSFCEYATIHGVPSERIKEWLLLVRYKKPQHVPSFYDHQFSSMDIEKHEMDLMFRKACLEAHLENNSLEVSQFYPDSLQVENDSTPYQEKQQRSEEREKFNRLYKHILPLYQVRAAFLFKTLALSVLQNQLNRVLSSIERDYDLPHRFEHQLPYLFQFLAVRLLDIAFYKKAASVVNTIEKGFTMARRSNASLYLAMAGRLSTERKYDTTVLQLLQKVEDSIEKDTLSGSEQLSHYTKAAVIGSRISYATGKFYFDKMVRTSEQIDEEGFKQIQALSSLILSEEGWLRPKLAFKFARFVEYCHHHLQRDHFPWEEGVDGIARLCPATGFAVLCRWDHRGVRNYDKHLVETLAEALKQRYVDHITAAALLPLNHYYWPGLMDLIGLILQGFDAIGDYVRKEIFVKDFVRDLQLHFSPNSQFQTLRDFGKLIEHGRYLSTDTVASFQTYYKQMAALLQVKENDEHEEEPRYKKHQQKMRQKKIFKNIDFTSEEAIRMAILSARGSKENGFFDDENFFTQMRQQVPPSQYTKHLSALLRLDAELVSFWSYKNAFLAALKEWSLYPDVQKWKKEAFFLFLKLHFSDFVSYNYFNAKDLNEFASAFGVSTEKLSGYLLQILPEYLDELSAGVLYEMLPFTAVGISKLEKEMLIEWLLPRWSQKIKPDLGDGPWNEKYEPCDTAEKTTVYFLRYFLAHPDKRIRWRAAHSLRRFSNLSSLSIANGIVPLLDNRDNNQFQDSGFLFYWLSAKLYFWVAMERISKENISFILPFASNCLNELKNNDTPHVLVRHFVKSICNQVIAHEPSVYSDADKTFIQTVNIVPDTQQRKQSKSLRTTRRRERKTRFQFDTLDTVPYWYEPMIRSLGCDYDEFLQTADEFITRRWGYSGDGYENDPARTDKWGLTSNRQGTEPIIEMLRTYFEYHAMFCAAGQLLKNVAIEPEEDDEDSEEGWLSKWVLCWENFWLADFRDPVPLLPEFWQKKQTHGDWEFEISRPDFDRVIGLNDVRQTGTLVVRSGTRIYYGKDYEASSVSSVLVHPKYASALLKALQTSDDLQHYLPFENDRSYYYDNETDEPFVKKGWVINYGSSRESIDDNDELYHDIDKYRMLPGTEFKSWANLQFSPDYRFSFQGHYDDWISRLQSWSNDDDDQHYDRFSSSGTRLEVKISVLLQFLRDTGQCLLLDCGIKRYPDRSYKRSEYYPEYTRLYLIYPNGRVETISGNYQLG